MFDFLIEIVEFFLKGRPSEEIINEFLRKIGKGLGVDSTYWFKLAKSKDGLYFTQIIEWTREGLLFDSTLSIPFSYKSQWMQFDKPYFIVKLSEIKEDVFRERFLSERIKSLLMIPVSVEERVVGIIGVGSHSEERGWRREEIDLLRVASYIFGFSIIRYELSLRLSDAILHLGTLLNSFPDIIIIKDAEGRWLFANRFTVDFFGLHDINYIGKTNRELARIVKSSIVKDTFTRSMITDEEIIDTKKPIKYIRKYEFPDGREVHFEVRKVPIYDEKGEFKGILSIAKDITQDVKLRKQIEETEKLKNLGLMAGNIAHDINNILTSIMGSASILEEKLSPSLKKYVETILKASLEAKDLAGQMLAYAGNRVVKEEVFDLAQEVLHIEKMLRSTIYKDIEFHIEILDEDLYFKGNKSQVQQIITNLVVNANDAIGNRKGKITVRLYRKSVDPNRESGFLVPYDFKGGVCGVIEVEDTGPGIPEEVREHIFDPFFSTKEKGKGLGLFSVFGIVKNYNGGIKVETKEGKGTKFIVYLPLSGEIPEGQREDKKGEREKKTYNILVVDDEPSVREILSDMLSFLGHSVVAVKSGKDALDVLSREKNVDVAILDYTMPEMNGLELYRRIKKIRPDLRIIFSSGYAKEDIEEIKGDLGILFLQKPYTIDALKRILEEIK